MDTHDPRLLALYKELSSIAVDGSFAVAFSGGVDSRFLSFAAVKLGFFPKLFHASGPHIPTEETAYAKKWAQDQDLDISIIETNILDFPAIVHNDSLRCYHCKHTLFTFMKGFAGNLTLCDGTQASDNGAYRPGRKALKELGISSPLLLASIDKPSVRELGALLGMDNVEQKAKPCLLTRFAYGVSPNEQILQGLAHAEEAVAAVLCNKQNTPDFRLRVLDTNTLELHIEKKELPELPHDQVAAITKQVKLCLPMFASFQVKTLKSLSGFFDRKSGLTP